MTDKELWEDYLVLEVLFELITRMTPSANHVPERTAFVESVFCVPLFRQTFGATVQEICESFNSATGTQYTEVTDPPHVFGVKTYLSDSRSFRFFLKWPEVT